MTKDEILAKLKSNPQLAALHASHGREPVGNNPTAIRLAHPDANEVKDRWTYVHVCSVWSARPTFT